LGGEREGKEYTTSNVQEEESDITSEEKEIMQRLVKRLRRESVFTVVLVRGERTKRRSGTVGRSNEKRRMGKGARNAGIGWNS